MERISARALVGHLVTGALIALLVLTGAGRAWAAANFTVARTSAADFFINNTPTPALVSAYASYLITNNDGVTHNNIWVKIGSFTGGVVSLDDAAAYKYQIGQMNNGDAKPAFFYLTASGQTTTAQSHDIQVYDGDPDFGGTLLTTNTFTLTTVQKLISSAANTITGGSVTPQTTLNISDTVNITLTGSTGRLGNGPGGTVPAY